MASARRPRDFNRGYHRKNYSDYFIHTAAARYGAVAKSANNEIARLNNYIEEQLGYWPDDVWSKSKRIREYEVIDAYDELVRHWKRLPRQEILVPRQQSIDARWRQQKDYIMSVHGEIATDSSIRETLAGAALAGAGGSYSGGMLSWALSAPGAVSAGIAGAVGVGGAGYYMYKNRKRKAPEPSEAVKQDMEQAREWRLMPEQRELLTETFSNNIEPIAYQHGYDAEELDQTLAIIDGPNHSVRTKMLLEWIDRSRFAKCWQATYRTNRTDAERAWDYLNEFSHSINFISEVTDAFELHSWPQIPLTIQALIRMDKRGAFMSEYEDEFIAIQEKQARMSEIQQEMVIEGQTAIVLGENIKYFEMRRAQLDEEFRSLQKEVILFDLKMAALAYAYDTGDKKALEVYSPSLSEKARTDQVELWRESIDRLCEMPIADVSPAMGTVIIGTINKLIGIDQRNLLHGSTAKGIADYVQKIAPHIRDEGAALEAMRKIDELLPHGPSQE